MNTLVKVMLVPLFAMIVASCATSPSSSVADVSNRVRLQNALSTSAGAGFSVQVDQDDYRVGEPIAAEITLNKPLTGYLSVLVVDENDQVNLMLPNRINTSNGPIRFYGTESLHKYLPTDLVASEPGGENLLVVLITSLQFNLYYRHCVHPANPHAGCESNGLLKLDESMIQKVIKESQNPENLAAYSLVRIVP